MTFSYYVTSAVDHDSQTMNMGLDDFLINTIFGGGNEIERMMKQYQDDRVIR